MPSIKKAQTARIRPRRLKKSRSSTLPHQFDPDISSDHNRPTSLIASPTLGYRSTLRSRSRTTGIHVPQIGRFHTKKTTGHAKQRSAPPLNRAQSETDLTNSKLRAPSLHYRSQTTRDLNSSRLRPPSPINRSQTTRDLNISKLLVPNRLDRSRTTEDFAKRLSHEVIAPKSRAPRRRIKSTTVRTKRSKVKRTLPKVSQLNSNIYKEGAMVEVLRSNGEWQLAQITKVDLKNRYYLSEWSDCTKKTDFQNASTNIRMLQTSIPRLH